MALGLGVSANGGHAQAQAIALELGAPAASRGISLSPVTRVGHEDRPDDVDLFGVTGGVLLEDGGFAVANGGSKQVLFFSSDGRLRARSGREGQGPGEYRALFGVIRLAGDSVLAFDWTNRRATIMAQDGSPSRFFVVEPGSRPLTTPRFIGELSDGSLAAIEEQVFRPDGTSGLQRTTAEVVRYDRNGRHGGIFRAVPDVARYVEYDGQAVWFTLAPFSPRAVAAAGGQYVIAGSQDTTYLEVFNPDGTNRVRITWREDSRAIGRREAQEYIRNRINEAPPVRQAVEGRLLQQAPVPAVYPRFGEIAVDPDDRIWIQGYPAPGARTVEWRVYSLGDGRHLGSVTFPSTAKILSLDSESLLILLRTELEVEYVALYRYRLPDQGTDIR